MRKLDIGAQVEPAARGGAHDLDEEAHYVVDVDEVSHLAPTSVPTSRARPPRR